MLAPNKIREDFVNRLTEIFITYSEPGDSKLPFLKHADAIVARYPNLQHTGVLGMDEIVRLHGYPEITKNLPDGEEYGVIHMTNDALTQARAKLELI